MKINRKIYSFSIGTRLCLITCILGSTLSCKKFLQVDSPPTSVTAITIFNNDQSATSALLGILQDMTGSVSSRFMTGDHSITVLAGISSDELRNYFSNVNYGEFYTSSIKNTNAVNYNLWTNLYKYIYDSNALIEGLDESDKISLQVKKRLRGEALFIRSLCYFYLVNLYGDVPLVLSTDYEINKTLVKTSTEELNSQIISDLILSRNALDIDYVDGSNKISVERSRPNKFAASALLARVYLYTKEYPSAEREASNVIEMTSRYSLGALENTFLKNSTETIWSIQPSLPGYNTFDGFRFILTSTPTRVALSTDLIAAFNSGDERRQKWIGTRTSGANTYYYAYKYKSTVSSTGAPANKYLIVLRLSEQYLIRAEARINQPGKIDLGVNDLNTIRVRARSVPNAQSPNPLPAIPNGLTKEEALVAVENERRVELFSEFGHRWFDLKRTGRANAILSPIKGSNWQVTDQFFPIPLTEMQRNPNLTPNN